MAITIAPHRSHPKPSGDFTGVPDSDISLDGSNTLDGKSITRATSAEAKDNVHAKKARSNLTELINLKLSFVVAGGKAPMKCMDTSALEGIQVKQEVEMSND